MRVITFICDIPRCGEKAVYSAVYDQKQKAAQICVNHFPWAADLAITSGDGYSGTLRLTRLQESRNHGLTPHWAIPGNVYQCNDDCGYVFTLQPNGIWKKTGKGYARVIGSWAQLEEEEGDCAIRLERIYGGRTR